MIRFHLDEHVDHAIARGLRQRGIDVTTATDAGLLRAADDVHVTFARREIRIIYTNDADFLRLHQQGTEHAGIVYCAPGARSVRDGIRFLTLMNEASANKRCRGRSNTFDA